MVSAEAVRENWLSFSQIKNRDYFDVARNGIIFVDSAGNIKNINKEAERICSVQRTMAVGQNAEKILQHLGDKFLRSFSLADDDEFISNTCKIKIKGQSLYIHVDTLKICDAGGAINGLVIIIQDLSAMKSAIKQIQTTQMLMSLGELAAGVAHHVRTPLTTISGYLQMMVNRLENDCHVVHRDVLEMMLDDVSHINNTVKELVLYAKPPISKEPFVNLNRLLEEALLFTFKEMDGEKIQIHKQLAENLPAITADANHLQQAVMNILENAMDAMPERGVLTLRSWLHAELNMIVVAICDTGSGLSSEALSRAFEPFYTTKLDGMGLGLPVAQRIVTEHGGFINISANETRGTKVHVYLPLKDERLRHLKVVRQEILNLQ